MYLALFLTPWMIGYALSTIAMNHRMPRPVTLIKERDETYANTFEPGTPPREVARQGLLTPRRITFTPRDRRLVVERMELDTSGFLNRFHRRRGFQQAYAADLAMAISVDAVIAAMVFWGLSGLWMWWEMRTTRLWGLACVVTGLGMFTLFVMTL
jgi:hypothetical protein